MRDLLACLDPLPPCRCWSLQTHAAYVVLSARLAGIPGSSTPMQTLKPPAPCRCWSLQNEHMLEPPEPACIGASTTSMCWSLQNLHVLEPPAPAWTKASRASSTCMFQNLQRRQVLCPNAGQPWPESRMRGRPRLLGAIKPNGFND